MNTSCHAATLLGYLLFRVGVDGWMDPLLIHSGSLWSLWVANHTSSMQANTAPCTQNERLRLMQAFLMNKDQRNALLLRNHLKCRKSDFEKCNYYFPFPLMEKAFNTSALIWILSSSGTFQKKSSLFGVRGGAKVYSSINYYLPDICRIHMNPEPNHC